MKAIMNKKNLKTLPTFRSEEEERNFWARRDSADYIDWTKAKRVVFPNLTPSVRTIDRKSTRLNSSHTVISYAVFCLKKKKKNDKRRKFQGSDGGNRAGRYLGQRLSQMYITGIRGGHSRSYGETRRRQTTHRRSAR